MTRSHGRFRESDLLRHLSESVVQHCMAEGLVGADGFAVDASLIAADANKQRSVPSKDWKPEEIKETAVRAAREYLATLDNAAFGAASPVTPEFISRSDPAPQWQMAQIAPERRSSRENEGSLCLSLKRTIRRAGPLHSSSQAHPNPH
jgi:hypothetical protein